MACPAEACKETAQGTVAVPISAKVFKLTPVTKQISARSTATLKLRIGSRALKAIGRAFKHHKKVRARHGECRRWRQQCHRHAAHDRAEAMSAAPPATGIFWALVPKRRRKGPIHTSRLAPRTLVADRRNPC